MIDDKSDTIDAQRNRPGCRVITRELCLDTSATTKHAAETSLHGSATTVDTSEESYDTSEPITIA